MREVLAIYPGAQRALFRRYHIGGCSSCGFEPEETLGALCARNGNLSIDEVIAHIETSHAQDQAMYISAEVLNQRLAEINPPRLVDIRTQDEYTGARIEGAMLFTQEVMQEMLGRWPRDGEVVFCDHVGAKSLDAAAYFQGHGFKNVRALRGGVDAWSREIDPKVRRYQLD